MNWNKNWLVTLLVLAGCTQNVKVTDLVEKPSVDSNFHALDFNYTTGKIQSVCDSASAALKVSMDEIAAIPESQRTFETVVVPLENAMTAFSRITSPVIFMKSVSSNQAVRDVAGKCDQDVRKLMVDIFVREDLFKAVKTAKEKATNLTEADRLLLEEFFANFRENGLELDAEKRRDFIAKRKQMIEYQVEYSKRANEWKDDLEVTLAELEGMPEDFIKSLKKTPDGKYLVPLDYPTFFPFMDNAKNGEARRKLLFKYGNRGGQENKVLLTKTLALRDELAKTLGFKTHADFVIDRYMAKTSDRVRDFLKRLGDKLTPKTQEELAVLLQLKKKDDPKADKIEPWDVRYYQNQLKKTKYQVDELKVAEYFPLENVLSGLFKVYQTILNVQFERDPSAPVWHPSVQGFRVKSGDKVISYFYMDLFPREGKYKHAAAFDVLTGSRNPDGTYYAPLASIVANFTEPTPTKPALLTHKEVETLFHEFGHIMHQVLTKAKYGFLAGTSVKRDFVEAPSQMLENWIWDKQMLQLISGHYKDVNQKLPDTMIEKLVASKLADAGYFYARQVMLASIDMAYHSGLKEDTTVTWADLSKRLTTIPLQEGTIPEASFGHLMGGYDAGYYGYLWSQVYAEDMFTRFEKEGLLNGGTGAEYRKWILEPGGEADPFALLRGFLGREPNEEAFLKSIGLGSAPAAGKGKAPMKPKPMKKKAANG